MDVEDLFVLTRRGDLQLIEFHRPLVPTMTKGSFASSLFNKYSTDGLGGGGKEMRAIGESRIVPSNQSQPGFMHQRGGLQGLVGPFLGHFGRRQFAQFSVNQRQ